MREEIDDSDIRQHQCVVCRHLLRDRKRACVAFPNGIPAAILNEQFDHRQAYPGDGGIQFAPRPGKRHPLDVLQGVR